MLQGELGNQAKEIDKLVDWLATDVKPEIVCLTNVLLSGMVHRLRERLNVPVLGMLQGDDIFLEMLPESYRKQAIDLMSEHCKEMQGFIATSRYYADFMSEYLRVPRERIDVVYPGINLKGHGVPAVPHEARNLAIGYFARICPEKGLHHLVDAYCLLRKIPDVPPYQLRVSGWLGESHRPYFMEQWAKLERAGLIDDFKVIESPDHAGKVRFLQSIDVLSVPTTYHEPKGLYILEAWANGVPVVQPAHGTFPELIKATDAGMLVTPDDPASLAAALRHLLERPEERKAMGERGQDAVRMRFDAGTMARATAAVFARHLAEAKKETASSSPEAVF
jgi:glycosyltransferase involved in cell wall biosynthesis